MRSSFAGFATVVGMAILLLSLIALSTPLPIVAIGVILSCFGVSGLLRSHHRHPHA